MKDGHGALYWIELDSITASDECLLDLPEILQYLLRGASLELQVWQARVVLTGQPLVPNRSDSESAASWLLQHQAPVESQRSSRQIGPAISISKHLH